MRLAVLSVAVASVLLMGAAPSPKAVWSAGIADENRVYSLSPHAMLKIQDAAYLHDGDTAVLVGRKGQPGSYRWTSNTKTDGVIRVTLNKGKLAVTKNGVPVDPATITKSIPVDREVDLAGQPTQVDAGEQGWRIFVFNQQNAAARNFKGVSYFPYDPAFRITAQFAPDAERPPRVFRTSRGTAKQFYRAGEARFADFSTRTSGGCSAG